METVGKRCRDINAISVIEWRISVSGTLLSGINVALTGHPRRYGKDTPFSRYRPPRRKENIRKGVSGRKGKKTTKSLREEKARGRRRGGKRQNERIAGWGSCVVCSGQYRLSPPSWPRRAPS